MEVEKLISQLSSPSKQTRQSALAALAEMPPARILSPLSDLILASDSSEVYAACLDLLEKFDAVAAMADVRADGWFDQVRQQILHVEDICQVMGEHLLAYAFVLGIQIRSLMLDPNTPWNTAVHFSLHDEQVQTLSLGEFKLRVVQALLQDERLPIPPQLPFDTQTAVVVIGGRTLLLAALYGFCVQSVLLGSLDANNPRYLVSYLSDEGLQIQTLDDFQEQIRSNLRREIAGMAEKPFTLDLFAVERARLAAAAGDVEHVIIALESWPGLLSMLLRTPVSKQLDPHQIELIGEGLALLGEALEKKEQHSWSEELYKLGMQFVRDGSIAARLFSNLGRMMSYKGEFGIAIGHLRRALSLGHPDAEVIPALGRAFLKQGKPVAAAALLEYAEARGFEGPHLASDLKEVRDLIAGAGVEWCFIPPDEAQPPSS